MTVADLKELFSPIGDVTLMEIYKKTEASGSTIHGLVETSRLRDMSAFKEGFGFPYESSLFLVRSVLESATLNDERQTTVVVTLDTASNAY